MLAAFVTVVLLAVAGESDASATLKLQMVQFANPDARDWDDTSCDWFSSCDHIFHFSIDLSSSNDDCKGYYYWTQTTGTFQDQNTNNFGSSMQGVANPIVDIFTPNWPGAVKFKVYIEDDDSPVTGNDPVDGIVKLLQLTPSSALATASWTSIVLRGVRPNHKTSLTMSYMLYCNDNYYSSDCSVYCVASDNDATGHYTCDPATGNIVCLSGWEDTSSRCTILSNDCISNQCQNGATCVDGNRAYTCTCPVGFTGVHCETNVNECASQPCQNSGTCTDLIAAFFCSCPPTYVGPTCSQPYCQMRNPCNNGGTCYGTGQCYCPPGFVGPTCEVNMCSVIKCENGGTCVNGSCVCPSGTLGTTCEIEMCRIIFCQHGGTCINGNCSCAAGFTGLACESGIDYCASRPCLNNGTCDDLMGSYSCRCLPSFSGPNCSIAITPPPAFINNTITYNYTAYNYTFFRDSDPADQPASGVSATDIWFYASFPVIFVLLVIIIVLAACLCHQRRRRAARSQSVVSGISSLEKTDREQADRNRYASLGSVSEAPDSPVSPYTVLSDTCPVYETCGRDGTMQPGPVLPPLRDPDGTVRGKGVQTPC